MNLGGASDRPVPPDIWKVVQAKMDNPDAQVAADVKKRGVFSVFSRH